MNGTIATTTAPVRVSFGSCGDTDYYIDKIGWGNTLNATIRHLYNTCVITPRYDGKVFLTSGATNKSRLYENHMEMNPFEELSLSMMIAAAQYFGIKGIDVFTSSNSPVESGLAGSTSHMIAMIRAYNQLRGKEMPPEEEARLAYHLERDVLGVPGGYQDQWSIAHGGLNYMEFRPRGQVDVYPLALTADEKSYLPGRMMLGCVPRDKAGADIHIDQAQVLKKDEAHIIDILRRKRDNTAAMKDTLERRDYDEFGRMMGRDWEYKRQLSEQASNPRVDRIYRAAIDAGALGGRFIGAGGGGGLLFYCGDRCEEVKQRLGKMGVRTLPFELE